MESIRYQNIRFNRTELSASDNLISDLLILIL